MFYHFPFINPPLLFKLLLLHFDTIKNENILLILQVFINVEIVNFTHQSYNSEACLLVLVVCIHGYCLHKVII